MTRRAALQALRRTGVMAVLDAGLRSPERLPGIAAALQREGIRVFQFRMKRGEDREALDVALALRRVLRRSVLLINDRVDVAAAARADGVHLGTTDLPVRVARKLLGPWAIVGVSTGTRAEMAAAAAARPDYVSVGPAFFTGTKRDAGRALGPLGVRRLLAKAPAGILRLAIGGVTVDNVGILLRAGADAVAAASSLTVGRDPATAARRVLAAVRAARER